MITASTSSSRPPHRIRLRGVFMRRTDWSGADMTEANLSGSDLSHARLVGVNFDRATLDGTILRGADLSDASNLTVEQLSRAVIDEATLLPPYIDRRALVIVLAE